MLAEPSDARLIISSRPLTDEIASSSGKTTDEVISSGLAPGKLTLTLTVAGSALGNKSTPNDRKKRCRASPKTRSTSQRTLGVRRRRRQFSLMVLSYPDRSLPNSPGRNQRCQGACSCTGAPSSILVPGGAIARRSPACSPSSTSTRTPCGVSVCWPGLITRSTTWSPLTTNTL